MQQKNVVGTRIRDARLSSKENLSQEDLAARVQAMGVELDQTMISRVETGDRQVTDIELFAICRALRISVGSLFAAVRLPGDG